MVTYVYRVTNVEVPLNDTIELNQGDILKISTTGSSWEHFRVYGAFSQSNTAVYPDGSLPPELEVSEVWSAQGGSYSSDNGKVFGLYNSQAEVTALNTPGTYTIRKGRIDDGVATIGGILTVIVKRSCNASIYTNNGWKKGESVWEYTSSGWVKRDGKINVYTQNGWKN